MIEVEPSPDTVLQADQARQELEAAKNQLAVVQQRQELKLSTRQELLQAEPDLGARELALRVRQRFQLKLHPRTIEKALKSKAKRGRQNPT